MRNIVRPMLLTLMLAGSSHVYSHHSFAVHFVPDETVTVTGTITRFRFANPHGVAYFTVTNEQGEKEEWSAETNSPNLLRRRGWTRDSLQPGDTVEITGWPARNEDNYMRIMEVTLPDGTVLKTQSGSRPNQD